MKESVEYLPEERGRGLRRERYGSICSAHQPPVVGCPRCACGRWDNVFLGCVGHAAYVVCPPLWRLFANLPWSRSRLFIQATFPNLRPKRKKLPWFGIEATVTWMKSETYYRCFSRKMHGPWELNRRRAFWSWLVNRFLVP